MKVKKVLSEINRGIVCPYCLHNTEHIDSEFIYGKSYGMIFICKPCNAWVGVHKDSGLALGRLANHELREAKKQAHHYFDQIARTGLINQIWSVFIANTSNRDKAYEWLSIELNIDPQVCHIGMMDVTDCKRVTELCIKNLQKYGTQRREISRSRKPTKKR